MKLKQCAVAAVIAFMSIFIIGCSDNVKPDESGGKESKYTVRFESDGTLISEIVKSGGSTVEEPTEPTREHYTFGGWYIGDKEWRFEVDTVCGDITLLAKWTPQSYVVTFVTDVGANVDAQTVIYDPVAGKVKKPKIKETVVTSTCEYKFDGWYYGDAAWNFDTDVVQKNMELIARWKLVEENTEENFLPSD